MHELFKKNNSFLNQTLVLKKKEKLVIYCSLWYAKLKNTWNNVVDENLF